MSETSPAYNLKNLLQINMPAVTQAILAEEPDLDAKSAAHLARARIRGTFYDAAQEVAFRRKVRSVGGLALTLSGYGGPLMVGPQNVPFPTLLALAFFLPILVDFSFNQSVKALREIPPQESVGGKRVLNPDAAGDKDVFDHAQEKLHGYVCARRCSSRQLALG